MKPNNLTVYNFVKENEGKNIIAADIVAGTGLPIKTVNGIITLGFQKKGLMERVPSQIKLEDGTVKDVKFVKLTDAGRELVIEAAE